MVCSHSKKRTRCFFYGRDKETDQLVKKLALKRFLAVVGDSGSGKSSLVKAGLISGLHWGRLALGTGETASWRVCVARPGDPFRFAPQGLGRWPFNSSERSALSLQCGRSRSNWRMRNAFHSPFAPGVNRHQSPSQSVPEVSWAWHVLALVFEILAELYKKKRFCVCRIWWISFMNHPHIHTMFQ